MINFSILSENIPRYSKKYSNVQQKGKKEGGWGEGIFALLRLEIERFRFSLIKRKPKQKIFHLLLKEKNGGQKKIKNVMKKFLFWFAVAERRQVETHRLNYHALRAYDLVQSHHARGACVSRGSVQKKLEFQPKGTANLQFQSFRKFYAPAVRSPRLRAGRKGLILQRFATLRVAKKKCFGFGFGSSFWRSQSKTKFCQSIFFCFAFGETWKR
jgi:hypothetical protein